MSVSLWTSFLGIHVSVFQGSSKTECNVDKSPVWSDHCRSQRDFAEECPLGAGGKSLYGGSSAFSE
jgi:hypothetical protein